MKFRPINFSIETLTAPEHFNKKRFAVNSVAEAMEIFLTEARNPGFDHKELLNDDREDKAGYIVASAHRFDGGIAIEIFTPAVELAKPEPVTDMDPYPDDIKIGEIEEIDDIGIEDIDDLDDMRAVNPYDGVPEDTGSV
jgi:hypothetical protein